MNIDAIKNYSPVMQKLIQYHVVSAIDFIEDMDLDVETVELDTRTLRQYREIVHNATIEFIAQDIDIESADINCVPETMKECVRKFINDNVTLSAKFG